VGKLADWLYFDAVRTAIDKSAPIRRLPYATRVIIAIPLFLIIAAALAVAALVMGVPRFLAAS